MLKQVPFTILLVLLSLAALSLTAQTKEIDSLYKKVKLASGKEQVDLYSKLAMLARNTNADSSLSFATKAYELAEKINYAFGKLIGTQALGRAYGVMGSYGLSKKYFEKSLDLAVQQKNDSLTGFAYNGVGMTLWQLGKHAEALENLFKSLQIRDKIKDPQGIATTKINIGMVYQSQDKLDQAEKYIKEGLDALQTVNEPSIRISALHTLANIYGQQGKFSEALKLDAEGIALCEQTHNEFSKSMFYDNMANCYMYGNPPDYNKAIEYFKRSLQIDSSFDNKKQMSDSYLNLGYVFLFQKKYAEAISYLKHSIVLAQESGYAQGLVNGSATLAKVYRSSGNDADAYETLQNSLKVKDSLFNVGSEAKMAEMQTLYETEKKQQQIELQQEQLSKKNFILTGIIVIFCLAALLGFSSYRRYRLQQKSRLQAEIMSQQHMAAKAVLDAEEKERQRIAKDLHDSVGQMMSAAKMNLSAFESEIRFEDEGQQLAFERIIQLVDESCKEVRNVSHNMMPNALLKNNLASALREFIDKLDQKKLQVDLYTQGLDERLDTNVETVLYRVIQECVNNVIRHAAATILDISLIKDKDGISATVEDNGSGFDTADKQKLNGMGLKNIITRIEYLKGTVEFDSTPGKGTLVALHVPV